jgi:hypothetical protein
MRPAQPALHDEEQVDYPRLDVAVASQANRLIASPLVMVIHPEKDVVQLV